MLDILVAHYAHAVLEGAYASSEAFYADLAPVCAVLGHETCNKMIFEIQFAIEPVDLVDDAWFAWLRSRKETSK